MNINKNVIQHRPQVGTKTANSIASRTYNKPHNFGSGNGTAVTRIPAKKRTSIPDNENLTFHNTHAIEQKVLAPNIKMNNSHWKYTQIEPQKQRNKLKPNDGDHPLIQNEDIWKYDPTMEYNLHVFSSPVHLSLNNMTSFRGNGGLFNTSCRNWMNINKNVIQHRPQVGTKTANSIASRTYNKPHNFGSGNGTAVTRIPAKKRTSIPDNENLTFHNTHAIEQKVLAPNIKMNNSHWKYTQIEPQKQRNKLKPNDRDHPSIQNEDIWKYDPTMEYNLHVFSSPVHLSLNNIASFSESRDLFSTSYRNWTKLYKDVIQHRPDVETETTNSIANRTYNKPHNFGSGNGTAVSRIPAKKRTSIPDNENLIFHNTHDIEQKVEQIENILVETRYAVDKISTPDYSQMDTSTNQQIDLNDISEQVYRLIDEKIKIECERRGIL